MNATVEDLRPTIAPKSDQLNADQLICGPMTITVRDVRVSTSDEQPVIVHYEGDNGRPFKPCKTMRKLLVAGWGANGNEWSGRSMTIYNDPAVKFGGSDVGGIRISHMSDIPRDIRVSLTSAKGKKALYEVKRMERPAGIDYLVLIRAAASLDELKTAFESATRSTKDASERAKFADAKDKRKAELSAQQ